MTHHFSRFRKFIEENSNFLALWLAQLFTQSAVSSITILVGILSDEGVLSSGTKESATGIGVIINLAMLPGLFVAPIAGVVADRFHKKTIMMLSNIWRFVFLFFFVLVSGWAHQIIAYALVLSEAIVLQFFMPAEGGLLPTLVKKKHILFANSLFSLTVYTTMGVGVALSGVLLSIFGIRNTFIVICIMFLISTMLLTRVKTPIVKTKKFSLVEILDFIRNLITDVKDGVRYSFSVKQLRFALTHLFLLQIVALSLVTLVFRIGDEVYGVSPRTAGVIVFLPLVIGLAIGFLSLNIFGRRVSRLKLIMLGTILAASGFALMSLSSVINGKLSLFHVDKIIGSISLLIIGISGPFILIPAQTLIYENARNDFRGRVLGVWFALTSSLASIVALLVSLVTDKMGHIVVALLIIVVVASVYSLVLYRLFRKRFL